MLRTPFSQRLRLAAPLVLAAVAVAAARPARAAEGDLRRDPALLRELSYIDALNRNGLAEYADMVLRDVQARWPDARAILKTKALEQVLSLGRFDEAEKMIRAEKDQEAPETWAMKLLAADFRFSRGQYPEALGAYQAFFKKYAGNPPAALVSSYANNSYKFVQMLLFLHRDAEALKAYDALLKLKDLPPQMRRQAQFEYAQLLVKAAEDAKPGKDGKPTKERLDYLASADKQIEGLLWEQDLWFGRSVALLAHVRALRGKPEEARDLVQSYMEQLVSIDRQLQEQSDETGDDLMGMSPIAECRYLVGTILADEADAVFASAKGGALSPKDEERAVGLCAEAMGELVNVYVQYPGFAWAVEAMERVEKIEAKLDELGYEVQSSITPEQRATVARKQFENANSLYHQNQFEKAVQAFESVLKNYPQVIPDSIQALGLMVQSCVELAEATDGADEKAYLMMEAESVAGGLAERFARSTREGIVRAGDTLRFLAGFFSDHGLPELSRRTMDDFFRLYPTHPVAADALLSEAARHYRGDPPDYAEAARLYRVLVENYGTSPRSIEAMRYLGDCYAKMEKTELEIAVRSNLVDRLTEGASTSAAVISARYSLARARKNKAIAELRAATTVWDDLRRGVAPSAPVPGAAASDGAAAGQDAAPAEPADPRAAALEALVAANRAVGAATADYNALIKILGGKDRALYESNAKEKDSNNKILLASLFDSAACYASLNQPEAQLSAYKRRAIAMYEMVVKAFPKNDNMPQVLLQLGTLWSTLPAKDDAEAEVNAKKATEYFDRLASDYPESDQARNALYRQGKALLDLGYRTQGLAKFKEMINTPGGKYTAQQLAAAADEIFGAGDYALAEQGYVAALERSTPEETALRGRIGIGRARILMAQERYQDARVSLESFIKENPRSASVVEANEMLCDACIRAAGGEADRQKRSEFFSTAIAAIQAMRPYKTSPDEALDLQLRIGGVLQAQAAVEAEKGDKSAANDLLRNAARHYQTLVFSADLSDMSLRKGHEQVFARAARTLAETGTYNDGTPVWEDVKDLCDRYLETFPQGESAGAVRKVLAEANANLAVGN